MTFKEVLAQVIDWLQQDKRITYRALKRQFDLDDAYLEDLKAELIQAKQLAVVFQKWRWPCLHCPSKGIAVDKQANDDVMHLGRFRKADGLAGQAFNARP